MIGFCDSFMEIFLMNITPQYDYWGVIFMTPQYDYWHASNKTD